jgi:hypothetical protein
MNTFTFIFSIKSDKTDQKEISSQADNESTAYAQFIMGLIKPATLVICKESGRRII